MRTGIAPCILLSLLSMCNAAGAQQTVLGVLEEVPGVYTGEPNSYGVRVVFYRDGQVWKAYPDDCRNQACLKAVPLQYPREIHWTISFDGKSLGEVTGETPSEFHLYSGIGLQKITGPGTVPSLGKASKEFAGFLDEPVHRPLVANSQPYFKDPAVWKPTQPSVAVLAALRQQFRKKYPKLCRSSEQDESKLEALAYRDDDVRLVKAYASRDGWLIARLHVNAAVDCSDTEAGFEMDDPWFTVDAKRPARYLESGIWLVDAGDYDNDGKSELLFSISRYDRGGYVLYYDNFTKHVAFQYSYH